MLNRKVKHGTLIHSSSSLCRTCRHAQIIKGLAESEEHTICGVLNAPNDHINFHVANCTKYDDKRQPSLGMMKDSAWELATDKSGKKIGFMSPGEYHNWSKDNPHSGGRKTIFNPLTGEEEY